MNVQKKHVHSCADKEGIKQMKAFTNRYELKYVIDWPTYIFIRKEIKLLFKKDKSAGKSGKYDVMSIYCDTPGLDFFWQKIDGEEERTKLRLRTYVHTPHIEKQDIFLELKKKKNQNVFKKRIPIAEKITENIKITENVKKTREFLHAPWNKEFIKEDQLQGEEIQNEMECLGTLLHLHPTIVISYTREPFVSADNLSTRITFDSNVRYRSNNFSLTVSPMDKHVLTPSHVIMEIKYIDHFPRWLVYIIQKYNCQARTFSKYCIGMEQFLKEQNACF